MAGSQPGATQSGEIFRCHNGVGGGLLASSGRGAKDAAQYSRKHRQAPTPENYRVPINKNTNSTKAEKSALVPKRPSSFITAVSKVSLSRKQASVADATRRKVRMKSCSRAQSQVPVQDTEPEGFSSP